MFAPMALEAGAKRPALSAAIHCAAIALLFLAGANRDFRHAWKTTVDLMAPLIEPDVPPTCHGGGGGGDRSPIKASKGCLPRSALRQFTLIRN